MGRFPLVGIRSSILKGSKPLAGGRPRSGVPPELVHSDFCKHPGGCASSEPEENVGPPQNGAGTPLECNLGFGKPVTGGIASLNRPANGCEPSGFLLQSSTCPGLAVASLSCAPVSTGW